MSNAGEGDEPLPFCYTTTAFLFFFFSPPFTFRRARTDWGRIGCEKIEDRRRDGEVVVVVVVVVRRCAICTFRCLNCGLSVGKKNRKRQVKAKN